MAWIVCIVIILLCLKETISQFNMKQTSFDDPRFGPNYNYGGFGNFYATTPPLPTKKFNPNAEPARPSDLYDMENKITRAGKWPEFIAKLKETGDKVEGSVMKNWEEDVYKWAAWVKNIDSPTENKPAERRRPPVVRIAESVEKPSLGMEMYWGKNDENDENAPEQPAPAPAPAAAPLGGRQGPGESYGLPGPPGNPHQWAPGYANLPPNGMPNQAPPEAQAGRHGYGPSQSYLPPGPPGNAYQDRGYAPPPPNGMPNHISPENMMSMAQKRIEFLEKQQQYGSPNLDGTPPMGFENQNPLLEEFAKSTNEGKKPSERDLIRFAFSKLNQIEKMLRMREMEINGTNTTQTSDDPFSKLPKVDDFHSPIRWVPFNSDATADGIAKVTDRKSKKNKQVTINGTIYVPVVDYDLSRLGLTTEPTTVSSAVLALYRASTEVNVLKTVIDNVDMKQPDEKDWLAFETIVGGDTSAPMCEGNQCKARCNKLGCQTMCDGDTCNAGCVGPACSSMCKGAGCSSMCIGESCVARCDGLSCDARCRGKNCEAGCQKPSCLFTTNGKTTASKANWNDYYPEERGSPDENDD